MSNIRRLEERVKANAKRLAQLEKIQDQMSFAELFAEFPFLTDEQRKTLFKMSARDARDACEKLFPERSELQNKTLLRRYDQMRVAFGIEGDAPQVTHTSACSTFPTMTPKEANDAIRIRASKGTK